MIHVITLFSVDPHAEEAFVGSLRRGGDWQMLTRRIAPDFVAAGLLHHQLWPLFLYQDLWISSAAYRRACRSPSDSTSLLCPRPMAAASFELGAFSFSGLETLAFSTPTPNAA